MVKAYLALALLVGLSLASITVYSPDELRKDFTSESIKVSYANFGVIPYGHSLKGRIYFDPTNPDGCEPYGEFDFIDDHHNVKKGKNPIIIAERGSCSFVQKVRNIEHAGGAAAIVVDDKLEDIEYVIMSDDGTGSGIRIPSMLVGRSDGYKFIDYLEAYGGTPTVKAKPTFDDVPEDEVDDVDDILDDPKSKKELTRKEKENLKKLESTMIGISFTMEKPDNRVEYDIWYTSTDDRALDFIDNFREYDTALDSNVLMTPHFVTFDCSECDDSFKQTECYADGKYCALNHKNVKMTGINIINEDLRQKCVYQNSMDANGDDSNYWDYMRRVHSMCPDYINEDCSRNAHEDLNIDWRETQACLEDSFDRRGYNDPRGTSKVLEQERKYWNDYGANFYPSIVVNNRTYRGVFEP